MTNDDSSKTLTIYDVQHAGDDQLLEWYRLVVDELNERRRLRAKLQEARG